MIDQNNKLNIDVSSAQSGSSFVGLHYENNLLRVTFPMGYHLSKTGLQVINDEIFNDISNLIRIIVESRYDGILPFEEGIDNSFPIYEYMYVIEYFIAHDCKYYKETEIKYDIRDSGKVSWNRTIKNTRPTIANNRIVYLDLMRRYNSLTDDDLITTINKYCVYEALDLLGALYGRLTVEKPTEEPGNNKPQWISFLYQKINQTNNDNKKRLFNSMIAILEREYGGEIEKDFSYGTREFHIIWERMVNKVFGSPFVNISNFYPSAQWKLVGSKALKNASDLRPDTVYISEGNGVYIIDSKYYSFGIRDDMQNTSLLPQTSDINKQYTYTIFAKQKFEQKYPGNYIGVFILPYDGSGSENIKFVGEALCEWFDNTEYKLYTCVLDVKFLFKNYFQKSNLLFDKIIHFS